MADIVAFRKRDADRIVKQTRDAFTQKRRNKPKLDRYHRMEVLVGRVDGSDISASGGTGTVISMTAGLVARSGSGSTIKEVVNPYSQDVTADTIVVCMQDRFGVWWITGADCT